MLFAPARGCQAWSQKNFPTKAILNDVLELNFTIKFVVLTIANAALSVKYVNYLLFFNQIVMEAVITFSRRTVRWSFDGCRW